MQRDMRALVDGAIGGAMGTLLMSGMMLLARALGLVGRLPPARIAETVIGGGGGAKEAVKGPLATVLHFGFGMTMGAVFGALSRRQPAPLNPGLQGVIFATCVWAVSYNGWIPALGIMPPPERDRPDRPLVVVLAHWVYGWTLGSMVARRGRA